MIQKLVSSKEAFYRTLTSIIRKANQKDIRILSKKLLALLEDKNSKVYQDNVAKFGIPEEYVKKAFVEETLLKVATTGKATFYLALENNEITGFAQTIQRNANTAELDHIIIFPEHTRKGIGTQLLHQALLDQKQKRINNIIVNTGKEESQARRFYEKNGFKQIKEATIKAPWGKKLTLVTYQLSLRHA
jgi:N-acetylglutamate synthase-like GNAT family acetyltransferase